MELTTVAPAGQMLMFVPMLVFAIIMGVCVVFPFWKIFSRAGLAGALSLLMFIPIVNFVMLYYLAFARWPRIDTAQDRN